MSTETFEPQYVRPAQKDCPRCGCCTVDLCERGRNSIRRCTGLTHPDFRDAVSGCPCSAEATAHTAAWRAAQVRVTRLARELPLTQDAETLLRALAQDGPVVQDRAGLLPSLHVRGLVRVVESRPQITGLGRTYLAARQDVRAVTAVRVVCVDQMARTAEVEVSGWRGDEPVTVLLDQIVSDTGLPVDQVVGRALAADANCLASNVDDLVLTGFRVPGPPQVSLDPNADADEDGDGDNE
jgi:hypothetical protein